MEELDSFPVILDCNDDILSFPPIINGDHTTVSETTTDFFIDVTGWSQRACEACLMLVCLSLAERGGSVQSVRVTGHDGITASTPRGDARQHRIPHRLIQKVLGLDLGSDEIAAALTRMGGQLVESRTVTDGVNSAERWADCAVGEREHVVAMPRWRSDIMHPIDIVEDIAIGYGYDNMPEQLPTVHLDAVPLKSSHLRRRVRASLRALGIQETQSLTLSNERDQFERIRWPQGGGLSIIANPITVDHTMLRQYMLPSLMKLLAANRHHELPQKVYELGTVVRDSANATRVAWACAEVGGGFTAAKGIAQALLRDIGAESGDIHFEAVDHRDGPWIGGRGARAMVSNEEIGQFGEIDPAVSHEFGLRSPIQAGEFDIDAISRLIPDPVLRARLLLLRTIAKKRHRVLEALVVEMTTVSHRLHGRVVRLPLVLDDLPGLRGLCLTRFGRLLPEGPHRCHVHATAPHTINTSQDSLSKESRDKRVRTTRVSHE